MGAARIKAPVRLTTRTAPVAFLSFQLPLASTTYHLANYEIGLHLVSVAPTGAVRGVRSAAKRVAAAVMTSTLALLYSTRTAEVPR